MAKKAMSKLGHKTTQRAVFTVKGHAGGQRYLREERRRRNRPSPTAGQSPLAVPAGQQMVALNAPAVALKTIYKLGKKKGTR